MTKSMLRVLGSALLAATLSGCANHRVLIGAQGDPPPRPVTNEEPPADGAANLNDRERAFQEMLTGAELVGHFTLDGTDDDAPLREERYSIASVTKLRGNLWRFASRIRYGNNDVTVPIVLAVVWAGNTPVIGVTDLDVPGLGTYTARVLFFNDKYAGTWSGKNYGGHLFGRIERTKEPVSD